MNSNIKNSTSNGHFILTVPGLFSLKTLSKKIEMVCPISPAGGRQAENMGS
jgi:hypothetical protein